MQIQKDYKQILKQELVDRCQRNPRYSLRAFARDLKLEPARLSDVLNGKKGLSKDSASQVAKQLGYSSDESEIFCDLVESLHARSQSSKQAALERVQEYFENRAGQFLTLDAFRAVSDWYHFSILQLLKIQRIQDDPAQMAKALEIQEIEVLEALKRLERLGLVENKKGKLRVSTHTVLATDGVPSDAVKKYHEQILKKAMQAIYLQSVQERDFFSMVMPVDSKDFKKAQKKIRKFVNEFTAEFSNSRQAKNVYCLSTQFFNLTPGIKESAS